MLNKQVMDLLWPLPLNLLLHHYLCHDGCDDGDGGGGDDDGGGGGGGDDDNLTCW